MVSPVLLAEERLRDVIDGRRDCFQLASCLLERHVDDRIALERRHAAEQARVDAIRCLEPEPRREDPIGRRRAAAALHVPEHGYTGLVAGALLDVASERVADAAESDVPELVGLGFLRDGPALAGLVRELIPLADDDDREVLAPLVAAPQLGAGLFDGDRLLRDQDHVGAAGDWETVFCMEARGHAQGVLAADCDERVEPILAEGMENALDPAVRLVRVRARSAENRSATREDPGDLPVAERLEPALDEAEPAFTDADHLGAAIERSPRHRADDGVQAGAIA